MDKESLLRFRKETRGERDLVGEEKGAPQEPERECCLVLALRRSRTLIPRIEGMPLTKWEMIPIFLNLPKDTHFFISPCAKSTPLCYYKSYLKDHLRDRLD